MTLKKKPTNNNNLFTKQLRTDDINSKSQITNFLGGLKFKNKRQPSMTARKPVNILFVAARRNQFWIRQRFMECYLQKGFCRRASQLCEPNKKVMNGGGWRVSRSRRHRYPWLTLVTPQYACSSALGVVSLSANCRQSDAFLCLRLSVTPGFYNSNPYFNCQAQKYQFIRVGPAIIVTQHLTLAKRDNSSKS